MLLEVKNLSCGYEKNAVVEHIDMQAEEGQLWCVLGANGIGKSTFFKTILGLLPPIRGEILFRRKELREWRRMELARLVAYVPQNHIPPFPFTVAEVAAMGRHPYQNGFGKMTRQDLEKVTEALHMLHILHLKNKIYTQISGGERQLVLLARAIVQETPILVLDEPVSNLDFGNHVKVISYIRNFVKMGKTVIMTTHCPDHAFLKESRVLLLESTEKTSVGMGCKIVTEQKIKNMYGVDNKIIRYEKTEQYTCIPAYEECGVAEIPELEVSNDSCRL